MDREQRWPYDLDHVLGYATESQAARDALAEAIRHHDQLPYDPDHDDEHTLPDWSWLLGLRLTRLSTPVGWNGEPTDEEAREYLAEIAAMAIRAMESLDRRRAAEDEAMFGKYA